MKNETWKLFIDIDDPSSPHSLTRLIRSSISPTHIYIKVDKASENIYLWLFAAVNATSAIDARRVVYHISVVESDERQLYLQLIILDRFEYNELSTRLMQELEKTILSRLYQSEFNRNIVAFVAQLLLRHFTAQSKFYFLSGMPLTPDESGHVLAFIFGTFFLVTLFMTLIYVVYYDDRHIPRFMATIRNRRFLQQSDVTFARFDNTSQAFVGDDSVAEVDLHFGTDQSIENLNSAFNNPMFDQNFKADDEGDESRKTLDEVELKAD